MDGYTRKNAVSIKREVAMRMYLHGLYNKTVV
jgi:hypothetical protein